MTNFSFCIITDNSREACQRILSISKSIYDMKIPNYEILVIGGEENLFVGNISKFKIRKINFDESIKKAWITRKKNIVAKESAYENIVMMHDYFIFHKNWYFHYNSFFEKNEYDVCCNPILMLNGVRDYTDWILWDHPNYPRQTSIPYNQTDMTKSQYISGGYFLVKKQFILNNPLNENMVAGQEEDVEWSLRIRDKARIVCNPNSYVKHIKRHRNMTIDTWNRMI